jgi:hypothetical protein
VIDVLSWLSSGLSDNDDLVAVQTKLEEVANWLSEKKFFQEQDIDGELGDLLGELSVHLATSDSKFSKALASAAEAVEPLEKHSRSAAYDTAYDPDDDEFQAAASLWEDLVAVLESLDENGVLDTNPNDGAQ